MRGCLGVLAGLIIGAAISFAVLAVAVAGAGTGAGQGCSVVAPEGWLIQVKVPWSEVRAEVSSTELPVVGGLLRIDSVEPAPCGGIRVWAEWEGFGTEVDGLGLVLESTPGARQLRPVEMVLGGRLKVSLSGLPNEWLDRLAGPVTQAGGTALARRLQSNGMGLCGLMGLEDGLALFLCPDEE